MIDDRNDVRKPDRRLIVGIDEAGYGPFFGPLVFGMTVFEVPTNVSDLWQTLDTAVTKANRDKRGRITVNDSKQVNTGAHGFERLARGVQAFMDPRPVAYPLPWYDATDPPLPDGRIARALLQRAMHEAGVTLHDSSTQVLFEHDFNRMVTATRSKAAVSLTLIARLLDHLWRTRGQHHPIVVVDRQSGRSHYRAWLAQVFDGAALTVEHEDETVSRYHLAAAAHAMTISFEVDADANHFPVALASMAAKFHRQCAMHRFNAWFTRRVPDVKPTQGYGTDANRFWAQIQPHLPRLGIDPTHLRRQA